MRKTKLIALIVCAMAMLTVAVSGIDPFDLADYGQTSYEVFYVDDTTPVLDGVISEGEYGNPIFVVNYGDENTYWSGIAADEDLLEQIIPDDVTLYLTYDNNYLYLGVTAVDDDHWTPGEGVKVWDGDYLEFDIIEEAEDIATVIADRTRYALGISNAGNVCGYYANYSMFSYNYFNFDTPIDVEDYHIVTRNGDLTTYEACLPWSDIIVDASNGAPDKALFYIQLGCAGKDLVDMSDYEAYLGVFRMTQPYTDDQKTELLEISGEESVGGFAYPVLYFRNNPYATEAEETEAEETETEAVEEETEAVSEEETEAEANEAEKEDAETEDKSAQTAVDEEEVGKEEDKEINTDAIATEDGSNTGLVIGIVVAAVAIIAVVAVIIIASKKKKA